MAVRESASKLTVRGVAVGVSIVRQTDTPSSPSPTVKTGWSSSTVATEKEQRLLQK